MSTRPRQIGDVLPRTRNTHSTIVEALRAKCGGTSGTLFWIPDRSDTSCKASAEVIVAALRT